MTAKETSAALVPEVGTLDRRVARMRRLGYLLDSSIGVPGTRLRFGIDSVIGLVPVVGDIAGGLLSLYIIVESARLGVPRPVLTRMAWNVALDVFVGEIPILGDLFDAGYKTNLRNMALLDGYLARPGEVRRTSRRWLGGVIAGFLLITAGAIALAVLLVRLLSGLFQ